MEFSLTDSRRLTGPNLFWNKPGAIIEVSFSGIDSASVVQTWKDHVRVLLDRVGWRHEAITSRRHKDGLSLVISAPMDALYAATEVNEEAWAATVALFKHQPSPDHNAVIERLKGLIAQEQNPGLLALQDAAKTRGRRFLSDDDEVSVGYGATAKVWPVNAIPKVSEINWDQVDAIPVALVTGTNGKSTTVRLAATIAEADGKDAGLTSTDYIKVGDNIIDRGDYSGPGGARTLLRHPDAEVAFLEVARGGLLRRGLGVNQADAVLITNVASDHLGEYGINTVAELRQAKFIVRHALPEGAPLILNADDDGVVEFAKTLDERIIWFSEHPENNQLQEALARGETLFSLSPTHLVMMSGDHHSNVVAIEDIPIAMGGAARHNLQNALAAATLCFNLGFGLEAIAKGLMNFHSDEKDNPGRANRFDINGITAIVDFAHNEHGLTATAEMVKNIDSGRKLVLMCQAGDRSDQDIRDLTRAACSMQPDKVVVCEIVDYLRGRELGEIPAVIKNSLHDFAINDEQIIDADSILDGVKKAFDWAEPGDVLLLLALTDRDQVFEYIEQLQEQ